MFIVLGTVCGSSGTPLDGISVRDVLVKSLETVTEGTVSTLARRGSMIGLETADTGVPGRANPISGLSLGASVGGGALSGEKKSGFLLCSSGKETRSPCERGCIRIPPKWSGTGGTCP